MAAIAAGGVRWMKALVCALMVATATIAVPPSAAAQQATISFGSSGLSGASMSKPTSLQFGPDDRLYVAQQDGTIKIFTVVRNGANDYAVTDTETITSIKNIPNYDDDGTPANLGKRQVTGIFVAGTASNPVIYVSSSDPRIGGGPSGGDSNLDTNSGIISSLTWTGATWDKVDLVRGLPRNEENHSTNGMVLQGNTLYVAQAGHTNMGGTSNNFAFQREYAYSSAILTVDLAAITNPPFDLPTLDDPDRAGVNDLNDPFGGNNGLNQAVLLPTNPVQIHATGFRNAYDVILTDGGRMYTFDNGPNGGWGDVPINEGPGGVCTDAINEPGATEPDGLHFVTGPGYYGGHPNPTRGNQANTFNGVSPVPSANPIECDYRTPGVDDGSLVTIPSSTNGLAEYTATNFGGAMQGDILAAAWDGWIERIQLSADGTTATASESLFSNFGVRPLDVVTQSDNDPFPGTVWAAVYGAQTFQPAIQIFEPSDFGGGSGPVCTGADDAALDEDNDGFDNADEIDNNTDPCSPASQPPDADGDLISDLNDDDDDNDGILDIQDRFAVDPANGTATTLPAVYTWDNDAEQVGGLIGSGFTGMMSNGTADYLDLFDPTNMTAGGAAGVFTVDTVPAGTARGSQNDQEYAFQLGFDPTTNDVFTVHTMLLAPFAGVGGLDEQEVGLFLGTGDQDNYVQIVADASGAIVVQAETNGSAGTPVVAPLALPGPSSLDLYLTIDRVSNTAQGAYAVDGGGLVTVGAPVSIPAAWLNGPEAIATGLMSTKGTSPTFAATWGEFGIVPGQPGTPPPPPPSGSAGEAFADATNAPLIDTTDPVAGNGLVRVTITPDNNVQRSNFSADSFMIQNVGSKRVAAVFIDSTTALFSDVVFDENGSGGDSATRPLTFNSGAAATGAVPGSAYDEFWIPARDGSFVASAPFNPGNLGVENNLYVDAVSNNGISSPKAGGGYHGELLIFDDFDSGETVGFSGDMDTNSIAGLTKSSIDASSNNAGNGGTFDVGGVSGAEMTGSVITVLFGDGTSATGVLVPDGSQAGASATITTAGATPTADLTVGGVSPGGYGTYGSTRPPIMVSGPVGSTVRVSMVKAFDPVGNSTTVAGGDISIDALVAARLLNNDSGFPVNNAVEWQHLEVTIPASGSIDITNGFQGASFDYNEIANSIVGADDFAGDDVLHLGFVAAVIDQAGLPLGAPTAAIRLASNGTPVGTTPPTNNPPVITPIGDQTSIEGDTINLAVSATDPDGDFINYTATGLPTGLSINPNTGQIAGTITTGANTNSPYTTTITVTDPDGATDTNTITWTVDPDTTPPPPSGTVLFRVNAGGAALPATDGGPDWLEDTTANPSPYFNAAATGNKFTASNTPFTLDASVPATTPTNLFKTGRWDPAGQPEMLWTFPTSGPGTYEIRLSFNEMWGNTQGIGLRVFDININGTTVANNYDIYADVGGLVAVTKVFTVTTTTNNITIEFGHETQNPEIRGIEILTTGGTPPPTNNPPVITPIGDQTSIEGDTINLAVSATDPDGDLLAYTATGLPTGLSINPNTGQIAGTITTGANANSPYTTTITAADPDGATDTNTITWTVDPAVTPPTNNPPVITPIGDQTSIEGDTINLAVSATDPDGDLLAYTATGLPTGLSINPNTGQIAGTITTGANANSPYTTTITVTDPDGATDTNTITWTVDPAVTPPTNNPPVITPIGDQTSIEGDTINLAVSATDPDGDFINYTATGLPTGLSINPNTGQIAGTITTGANTNSPYTTTITVTDPDGATDTNTITWTVDPDTTPPPPSGTVLFRVNAGGAALPATDGGPDWLEDTTANPSPYFNAAATGNKFTASNTPFTLDASVPATTPTNLFKTGRWDPAGQPEMLWTFPTSGPGTYEIRLSFNEMWGNTQGIGLRVFDININGTTVANNYDIYADVGGLVAVTKVFTVTTTTNNITIEFGHETQNPEIRGIEILTTGGTPPPTNNPPVITPIGDQTSIEGDTINLAVSATDPDGDLLAYTATGLPTGLSINPNTGQIAGTITTGANANSPYTTTITAADPDGATDTNTITWTVDPAVTPPTNNPPVITPIGDQTSIEGDTINLAVSATDPDGDLLAYTATGLPTGLSINPNTGQIAGTITTGANANSPYTTTITAADPDGATDTNTITWTVDPAVTPPTNNPPVITPIGDQTSIEGDTINLAVSATDPDGDFINYTATGLPTGLSINPNTGQIAGTITTGANTNSPYTTTITVTDPDGATDTNTITWTVDPAVTPPTNNPPVITPIGDQTSIEGDTINLAVSATDPDGDFINYTATGLPTGLSINPNTGQIAGTITTGANTNSPYTTTITVTDPDGATDTNTITWTVDPDTTPPPPSGTVLFRVNAGGAALPATDGGPDWLEDTTANPSPYFNAAATGNKFTASNTPFTLDASVPATTPTNLFKTGRWDPAGQPEMLWTFPTSGPGTYEIRLSFNEMWGNTQGIGLRVFDININGTTVANNYDIYADVGGLVAVTKVFTVTTTTNNITIEFGHETQNPEIRGIEILTTGGTPPPTNNPPVITPIGDQTSIEGDTINLAVSATDPDGDLLAYTATGLPTGLSINPNTGQIAGTITTGANANSPYTTTITAADPDGATDTNTITWTVDPAVTPPTNNPPVITPIGDQTSIEGDTINLAVSATDPDGDLLAYTATGLPTGLSINPNTGQIAGTITTGANANSPYTTTITAADPDGATDTNTITWTVDPAVTPPTNNPPVITPIGDQTSIEGDTINLAVSATDPDGDFINYTATGLPTGLSINPNTGQIAGTITTGANTNSPYTTTITVTDPDGATDTNTITWTVDPDTTPPPPSGTVLFRVNAGGAALPATDGGPDWLEDTTANPSPYFNAAATGNKFTASNTPFTLDASVPATTPTNLFKTGRWDPAGQPEMLWTFPTSGPGTYEIRLSFNEMWGNTQGIGLRVFDININGTTVANNYDIYADVGGLVAVTKVFTVTTTTNNITIEFGHETQNPEIRGIEILTTNA